MADDDVVGGARIRITLDDTGVQADAFALGRRIKESLERGARGVGNTIRQDIQRALRRAVSVRIEPDLSRFDAQLLNGLRHIDSLDIPVAPDLSDFMVRLRAALAGEEVSIRVVPDLDDFDARIRAHRPPPVTAQVDADPDSTNRLAGALGSLRSALRIVGGTAALTSAIGLLGAAAATAAGQIVTLVAALAPAAGIVAALPAAITGAVVAFGALKLALMGVGDAFKAALTEDLKKFKKELDGLPSAARAAAWEVRSLKPAFEELRSEVQAAFFEPLEGQIRKTAKALGGPLRKGLSGVAGQFGAATAEVAKFVASARGVKDVEAILAGTQQVTKGLTAGLVPAVEGFTDLAAAIQTAFGERLGDALAARGEQLGAFMEQIASDGRAVAWVEQALSTFRQLGTVLENLGSIFDSVLDAARTAGGDILGVFSQVTGRAARFLESDAGQASLVNIFRTLGEVGSALSPVITELVKQVGALAPAFVPIVQVAGPTLTRLLAQLGTALQAMMPGLQALTFGLAVGLSELGPALEPLGSALGALGTALTPLLPLAGQIAATLGAVLAPALQALASVLGPVVEAFAASLAPVLPQIAALFGQVAAATLPLVAVMGQQLGTALQQLLPPILALIPQLIEGLLPAFQQILTAVMPLLPLLVQLGLQALQQLLPPIVALIPQLIEGLLPAFTQLLTTLTPLLPMILDLAMVALQPLIAILPQVVDLAVSLLGPLQEFLPVLQQLLPPLLRFGTIVLGWVNLGVVLPMLQLIVGGLKLLMTTVTAVVGVVASMVGTVIGWFKDLYNVLVGNSIIPDLINGIIRWFARMPGSVINTVVTMVSNVIARFGEMPGKAARAVGDLGRRLGGAISDATGSALSAAGDLMASIAAKFAGLGDAILAAVGDIGGRIMGRVRSSIPSAVRDYIPFLANGAIVTGPTLAVVGEAGPEVVIPLTRPQRARDLAQESGLLSVLAGKAPSSGAGGGSRPAAAGVNVTFNVTASEDAEATARLVLRRLAQVGIA
ncbi:hypothetical protein F0L17_14360 [Streptomyces sp. TRM43335]|uniref:Phage-related protein n=1 Tax=Streptomyces taklimakanensis TaxID=2569853 RepID=A0A6G2BDE7_9ACTN|nr:hypothetical protein [Streptomyces taklimakanensis]MTE20270.1 hypothetical protein [Streptomyces taklimakanensis]